MFAQTLVSGLLLGGLYAIIGMGMAIIFGTMGVVNFAHGQWVMVGMYSSYFLFTSFHLDPYLSLPLSFGVGFLLGLITFRLAVNRVTTAPHSTQILLMAGIGMMLTNIAQMIFNTNQRTVNLSYSHTALNVSAIQVNQAYLISFLVAVAIAAVLIWFVLGTETGRAIRGIAQNKNAAALMGINVRRVSALVFALGIGVATAAGTLLLPMHYVDPSVGQALGLTAFIVVVIGGMGSILGAGLGGLLIGLIMSFTGYYLGQSYADVFTYVIFLLVLLVKPSGLMGRSRI